MELTVKNKPAVKIFAVKVATNKAKTSTLYDCESEKHWFPNSCVKYNEAEKSLLIQEWLFNQKFPNG